MQTHGRRDTHRHALRAEKLTGNLRPRRGIRATQVDISHASHTTGFQPVQVARTGWKPVLRGTEMLLEELAGVRRFAARDRLGRAGEEDLAAAVPAFGAEV